PADGSVLSRSWRTVVSSASSPCMIFLRPRHGCPLRSSMRMAGRRKQQASWINQPLLSLRLERATMNAQWSTACALPAIPRLDVVTLHAAAVIVVNAEGVRLYRVVRGDCRHPAPLCEVSKPCGLRRAYKSKLASFSLFS